MDKQQAKELLTKYDAGTCTESERALVEAWYFQYNEHPVTLSPEAIMAIGQQTLQLIQPKKIQAKRTKLWKILSTSAAILALAIASFQFFLSKDVINPAPLTYIVPPGTNKATLTLANGQKIELDSTQTGILISPTQITYSDGKPINSEVPQGLNIITTPRGGEYQLTLPDGSKVWLNAASSLSYPSVFAENQRNVELTGEAYFEVAHDPKKPFLVRSSSQIVRVLGTAFNINSYGDEPATITTLQVGSVTVHQLTGLPEHQQPLRLSPGERSVATKQTLTKEKADLETALAWKNGKMEFKNEKLETILREVSRWYAIDIVYKGAVPKRIFNGSMSRKSDLSALLKILELSKINYQLSAADSRKLLTISP